MSDYNRFNATTKEVCEALMLSNEKTLFRRRTDFGDSQRKRVQRFLEPGVHFRRKTPDSKVLLWDLALTIKAWNTANYQ